MEAKDNKITQSAVMELGFTKKMIETLLPPPTMKKKPVYTGSVPVKVWDKAIVESVMQTEAFVKAKAIADKRRKSAQKAVEAKRAKTNALAEQIISTIKITVLDENEVVRRAVKQHNREKMFTARNYVPAKADKLSESTRAKWAVAYILERLTRYDENLWDFNGMVGGEAASVAVDCAILEKIAAAYPAFKEECRVLINSYLYALENE